MQRVNVNDATQDELGAVTGIRGHGFEIGRYRDHRGRFDDLLQLEEVPGLAGKVEEATAAMLAV